MKEATAAPRKPREITYFEMTGTAGGTKMRLTNPSLKALTDAANVLNALSKAGAIFPKANGLCADLTAFIHDPTT